MVMLMACTCSGLPAHSHAPTATVRHNGRVFDMPLRDVELNPGVEVLSTDPDRIHLWVDWKAVARSLMAANGSSEGSGS